MARRKSVLVYIFSHKKVPKYHSKAHYFTKALKRELRKYK